MSTNGTAATATERKRKGKGCDISDRNGGKTPQQAMTTGRQKGTQEESIAKGETIESDWETFTEREKESKKNVGIGGKIQPGR